MSTTPRFAHNFIKRHDRTNRYFQGIEEIDIEPDNHVPQYIPPVDDESAHDMGENLHDHVTAAVWNRGRREDKFYFNVDESIKRKVFMVHLARIYGDVMGDWRCKAWEDYQIIEEGKQHLPEKIDGTNWAALIDYWRSPAFQEKSKKNAANCAKSVILYNSGSRPFTERRLQHIKETGVGSSAIDMWKKTHMKLELSIHTSHTYTIMSSS